MGGRLKQTLWTVCLHLSLLSKAGTEVLRIRNTIARAEDVQIKYHVKMMGFCKRGQGELDITGVVNDIRSGLFPKDKKKYEKCLWVGYTS